MCGAKVAAAVKAGNFASVTCYAGNPQYSPYPGTCSSSSPYKDSADNLSEGSPGVQAAPGKCDCDNSFIDQLAQTFVEAIPAIADVGASDLAFSTSSDIFLQIGREILISAFQAVLDVGAAAIPRVGEAIDAGMSMSISVFLHFTARNINRCSRRYRGQQAGIVHI